jgi:hypothetical protein
MALRRAWYELGDVLAVGQQPLLRRDQVVVVVGDVAGPERHGHPDG